MLLYHHLQLYAEKVAARGLCAIAQCESLRYKLIGGLAVRRYKLDKLVLSITFERLWLVYDQCMLCVYAHLRACYGVLRFIMESGAKGCEVVVSGKLRGQRAKSMKFVDGLMIHAGNPIREYIDSAITHVHLRQGM